MAGIRVEWGEADADRGAAVPSPRAPGPPPVSPAIGASIERLLDDDAPPGGAGATDWSAWVATLLARGEGVLAVLLYGSRVAPVVATPDSEPDFYVVVDSVRRYTGGAAPAALAALLPPWILHVSREDALGRRSTAKACVISTEMLLRETAPGARDLHHAGRFSKRMALLHARSTPARATIRRAQRQALAFVADLALARLPGRFTVDEFALEWIGLSYRAEPRVVEPDRARALFAAHAERYRTLARLLLRERGVAVSLPAVRGVAWCLRARPAKPSDRAALDALIRRSRRRERLRWPAYLVSFDGWLDYVLRKIERHHGRPVPLTAVQRRHPLLLGWPVWVRLRRAGVVD